RAVTEETFGPTVTVARVADLGEGVKLANASRYGLGASVFAGNKKAGMAAARSLRSGMTAVNSVIAYASVPSLPFGGAGGSGAGRAPGRGRAGGVPPAEGDHQAADEAAGQPPLVRPHRQGHAADPRPGHPAARQALQVTAPDGRRPAPAVTSPACGDIRCGPCLRAGMWWWSAGDTTGWSQRPTWPAAGCAPWSASAAGCSAGRR